MKLSLLRISIAKTPEKVVPIELLRKGRKSNGKPTQVYSILLDTKCKNYLEYKYALKKVTSCNLFSFRRLSQYFDFDVQCIHRPHFCFFNYKC